MSDELETERAAAIEAIEQRCERELADAVTARNAECTAADDEYQRAHAPIQARYDRVERNHPGDRAKKAVAIGAYERAIQRHDDKREARHKAAASCYAKAVAVAKAGRDAARTAADAKFDKLRRAREAKAERERLAAEHEREREEQEAERERVKASKLAERQRVAERFEQTRRMVEAALPPVVKISPAQAAARLGMKMESFWARVRSGRYPAPDDDNQYFAETVDRFPRPKVRTQRTTPRNVYTDIWRF